MHKKSLRLAAGLCAAGLLLAGCGPVSGDSGAEKIRLMVWSPSEDQSKDAGAWLQTCCDRFAELHPEWDITFVYGVADEATAAGTVSQDAEARQLAMVVLAMLKGLDQASQGLSLLNSNLDQYVAAVSDISAKYYDFDDGLHSMSDGLTELNRGTSSMRSEVKELPSQIGLLAKGQEEMKNGVESAVQKVNDMAGGNSTSVKPVSFVSPEKANVRSVQFVLRTLEIKKRSDEIETAVVDERQESFWDRFLNLFKRQ